METTETKEEIKVAEKTEDENAPWLNKVKLSTEELIKKKFEECDIVPGFLPESPSNTILIIYQSGNHLI